MKQIILIVLMTVMLAISSSCDNSELKYEVGKDTVDYFGDGTYQVIHQVNKSGDSIEILSNQEYKQCMLTTIDKYKNSGDKVYFTGKYYENNACCVVDINTNMCRYYIDMNEGDEFIMVYGYDMQKNNDMLLLKAYDEFSQEEQRYFEILKTQM
ncbi:MAG: hypothetical protein J6N52_09525 [Clostridia bacterium]|nr:hypothetical protein [Clostridia bacterium]